MYKYMEMRPEKKVKKVKDEEEADGDNLDAESVEDPDLEKFAEEEMDREMKRMVQGAPGGMPDTDEEEISMDRGSDDEDESDDGDGEGDGFFSGEDDLQDVEIEKDDQDEDDDEGEDLNL